MQKMWKLRRKIREEVLRNDETKTHKRNEYTYANTGEYIPQKRKCTRITRLETRTQNPENIEYIWWTWWESWGRRSRCCWCQCWSNHSSTTAGPNQPFILGITSIEEKYCRREVSFTEIKKKKFNWSLKNKNFLTQ